MPTHDPVVEIDAATLRQWIEQGRAVVVDVREPDEHARERIPGSRLVPLSRFDPAQVPAPPDANVVLHCKGGVRSAQAAARLVGAGRAGVMHLKGGLDAWKSAGGPTEQNPRVPISIMRQVQITVGVLVLATCALAWLASPYFLALTAVLGAGLLFSGATGTCGMAAVLALMPWNRAVR